MTPSHRTAVVLVPPLEIWGPIQAIRRRHDRHYARWMPHVTLLYPFAPEEAFGEVAAPLAQACARVEPFALGLSRFGFFDHGRGRCTLWLAPEPAEPLVALHASLLEALPAFGDTGRHPGGFTPHLSVGQCPLPAAGSHLARLAQGWAPLRFDVRAVALLRRDADGPFEIAQSLRLGAA